MLLPPDIKWQQRLKRWSVSLLYLILLLSLLVLLGWQINSTLLKNVTSGLAAMNPATAVCFLLSSISALLFTKNKRTIVQKRIAISLAVIVSLIGLTKVLEVLLQFHTGLDTFLFHHKVGNELLEGIPNRMSPNTAICFFLTGFIILQSDSVSSGKRWTGQILSVIIIFLGLLSLLGYLYQVKHFFGLLSHIQMALHTALCFFLLGFAVLFAQPDKGFMSQLTSDLNGSYTARILLPAAIIVPAAMGFLRLWGYWTGIYNNEFGVALYALITIIIFVSFIWYNTYSLNKRDLLRKATEEALHRSEIQSRGIFDNAPDSIVVIDQHGNIVNWNLESEKIFGWKASEVIGKSLGDTIVPKEFRESHRKGMQRYLSSGESTIMGSTIDLWGIRKDGTEVDVSLRISPLVLNEQRLFIGFIRDITERKLIEEKLKTFNEELARQVEDKTAELTDMFERVTNGFIALDKNFCYTYVNKKAGELIHKNPADLIGKNVWEVFPQAVGSETYEAFNRALNEQEYITHTDYYAPLNLWQENHIYPSQNGLSVFITDITEKKKADELIRETSELAEKLIDSLPGVFYFFDATGKFIRWNKQFEEITGYSSEEVAQMHPVQFFGEGEQEYIAGRIGGVFEHGLNDAEASFLTKSGKFIPHYFKAVRITYQGGHCLLGNGIDITERKQAEERLRASEQKYKLLFESNPLPMWMLRLPDYDVREVNIAALKQYGYEREEFLALDIFTLRPDEDIDRLKRVTNRNFRGIFHAGIWRHQKKNGSVIYVDVITHDIYYDDKPVRLVLANEVTEQYLAEEKLKESYESIRQLTEHLQNIREEERLHIAREIHDELGQLLTVLKMDVSWLNKKVQPASEPVKAKLTELLGLIDTTVKTVRRIASELRPSLLDDLGLVAAMEWHLEEFERRSGIEKESFLPSTELNLPDSNKIGLFRILQESLTNVARHSAAKKVVVRLIEMDNQLILTIADDGKGIDSSKGERKTLGLLGMKERTLVMGGEYDISSKMGEGTTVTVKIPLLK